MGGVARRARAVAGLVGVAEVIGSLIVLAVVWKLGEALEDAWEDGDERYMLISCSGEDPRGWDEA